MTWGHWYWPLAILIVAIVSAGLFFPAETYAFFSNHNNTLSDFLRTEFNITTAMGKQTRLHTWAWWASFVAWVLIVPAFVVWFTGHIWFDTWG